MDAIGWGWAGVIWLFSFIFYLPLDLIKFAVRYILRGNAWELITERRVCIIPELNLLSTNIYYHAQRDLECVLKVLCISTCRDGQGTSYS